MCDADYDIWKELLGEGILTKLCNELRKQYLQDSNYFALWIIYQFLLKDNEEKLFLKEFQLIGGIDIIENLQELCPEEHYKEIVKILTKFYGADEEDDEFKEQADNEIASRMDQEMIF